MSEMYIKRQDNLETRKRQISKQRTIGICTDVLICCSSKDTAVQWHRLHMAPLIILFQSGTIRRTVVSGFVCIPLQGA